MKILHITPHLGGGVGKAHAALCAVDEQAGARRYVLLEAPRDRRHADAIMRCGARLDVAPTASELHGLMSEADIVQFEWWNHPLMCHLLAGAPLPAMRSVLWSHVSGLGSPIIPAGLIASADRFVFTSACSLQAPHLVGLDGATLARTEVINSGFGYPPEDRHGQDQHKRPGIGYVGTVDFAKMSPAMMEVIDRSRHSAAAIDVWGDVTDQSAVDDAIAAMHAPSRFRLRGHAPRPKDVFSRMSIFLYLLQPYHFGTAENALIEAMSMGCAPLVFANPCEREIVRDGETGIVVDTVDQAVERLDWMLAHPSEVRRMGRAARLHVSREKTPARSLAAFGRLWTQTLRLPKRQPDFAAALKTTPRDWYEALRGGREAEAARQNRASKGSLEHFRAYFPDLDAVRTAAAGRGG